MMGSVGRPSAPSTRSPRVPWCDSTQPIPARVAQPSRHPAGARTGHLCASGGDLSTAEGWRRAVLAYNPSTAYVLSVHAAAATYAR